MTSRDDWRKVLDGVDAVLHLAAETGTGQSMYEIEKYVNVNIGGTAILLDILTRVGFWKTLGLWKTFFVFF